MITTSSSYRRRRSLTFPAIHPCPSASPATLIASLIALATEIDSSRRRRSRFPVLRRMARESFRHVGVLLLLLQDIRSGGARVPESAALALSELHVALQKMKQLISDCSRTGARLWVLMNSDRVLSEFTVVLRSISTALDVLPITSMDADDDVKETIKMLARQSCKSEVGIDRDDDRTIRAVRSIMRQFRSGVSPDPVDLRRVLDILEIKNWADCNEEIAFLEEELLENSDGDHHGEAALLGSLIGFFIYCRALLFENDGGRSKIDGKKKGESGGDVRADCINPESFRCPISLEVMTDPVTISTGQTYDRASILRWFKDGFLSCPVTGEKLKDTAIVPNSTIQKLIRQKFPFTEESSSKKRDLAKTQHPQSLEAAEATRMTTIFLARRLSKGTDEDKNRAAYEMRLLSKSSLFQRVCLVEADSVPWLLHLLYSSNPSIQDNAVAALLNLSKHPSGQKAVFEVGGLNLLVDAINHGLKIEVQQNAAAIIFYLSQVDEYRQEIGEFPEAIPALVNLLKIGTYRAKKNAIVALFGLLSFQGNHSKVIATGAINVVIDLLTDDREDLVNDSIGILAQLAERKEGAYAILRSSSDLLPRLMQVLQSSTSRSGKEYSVSLMLSLCCNGGLNVIGQLESMPLLMPSLYSIIIGGPPQASKKARSLINHIHQVYDQNCPVTASTQLVEDHVVVHVLLS